MALTLKAPRPLRSPADSYVFLVGPILAATIFIIQIVSCERCVYPLVAGWWQPYTEYMPYLGLLASLILAFLYFLTRNTADSDSRIRHISATTLTAMQFLMGIMAILLVVLRALLIRDVCLMCLAADAIFIVMLAFRFFPKNKAYFLFLTGIGLMALFPVGWLLESVSDVDTKVYEYTMADGEITLRPADTAGYILYDVEMTPVLLIPGTVDVIYLASWCKHCDKLFDRIEPERWDDLIIVDCYIDEPESFQNEIELIRELVGERTNRILYDLDSVIRMEALPHYEAKNGV